MEDEEMAAVVARAAGELAKAVRARRTELGWSQEALAARMTSLGVPWHQTTVAKVESAAKPRALSAPEIVGLTLALGLPKIEELFGSESQVSQTVVSNYSALSQRRYERDLEVTRRLLQDMTTGPDAVLPADAVERFEAELALGQERLAERRSEVERDTSAFAAGVADVDSLLSLVRSMLASTSQGEDHDDE